MELSRRAFLARSAFIGCSAAASPLLTPVSFAAAPWDNRLVVIILRGGMDGLDVIQPYGDPDYAGLRPSLAGGPARGGTDLDGYYALHPGMSSLLPLWRAGELGFVQAVSTPYRRKRSHFEGQDLLEAGLDDLNGPVRDGWLNRMLQAVPGVRTDTAYAIGRTDMKLLAGAAPVANWSPEADLSVSPQAQRLLELVMEQDPAFHAAMTEALALSMEPENMMLPGAGAMQQMGQKAVPRRFYHMKVAEFAAQRLRGDARIAAFSLNGWDTHQNQTRSLGQALERLSETILTLKSQLPVGIWARTSIVAMTEFGRTARENGTRGTDHGTGGAMVLAGGAIRGGKIYGSWPGLASGDLHHGRDLRPTSDVRSPAAWIMQAMTGLNRDVLQGTVFPGLDMGDNPGLVL